MLYLTALSLSVLIVLWSFLALIPFPSRGRICRKSDFKMILPCSQAKKLSANENTKTCKFFSQCGWSGGNNCNFKGHVICMWSASVSVSYCLVVSYCHNESAIWSEQHSLWNQPCFLCHQNQKRFSANFNSVTQATLDAKTLSLRLIRLDSQKLS